jgi:hypothetical protein
VSQWVFLDFNVAFAGFGAFIMLDANGALSDVLTWQNVKGFGVVKFWSDPTLPAFVSISSLPSFGSCVEGTAGCEASFGIHSSNGTLFILNIASEGEIGPFDPFGVGFDTSDDLEVAQLQEIGLPDPKCLVLKPHFAILNIRI